MNQVTPTRRKRSPTPPAIPAMMAPKFLLVVEFWLGMGRKVGEGVRVE